MLVPILLALAFQSAPVTYREATALPPAVAGARLLAGEAHRPVERIERESANGAVPPGSRRLFLYERPERITKGCARRRWTVDFFSPDPARPGDATMGGRAASEQVGLVERGSCKRATFVGSNGPGRAQVLAMLSALARWRARPDAVVLTCAQAQAFAAICGSPAQTRAALMRAVPWHAPAPLQLWVTIDGRGGYTVSFDALPARTIAFSYRVPAPF